MRLFLLLLSLLFFACNNSSTELKSVNKETPRQVINQDSFSKIVISDTAERVGSIQYVWLVDFENKTKKRNPKFKPDYLNIDTLINGINQIHPNIILEKIKISGDTLFTEIKDSEYLGERMGTTGAASYLADVVINLTSVSKIKYVKIDFDEGSHATPGIWSAKDFSDYKEIR